MKTNEIRVRPVVRHVVTRYEGDPATSCGGSRTLGEFDNEGHAEEVAEALRRAHGPKQYAIIERGFDVCVAVWYAEEREQAEAYRDQLQAHFEKEFRIYERDVTDPSVLGRMAATLPGQWKQLNLPSLSPG